MTIKEILKSRKTISIKETLKDLILAQAQRRREKQKLSPRRTQRNTEEKLI
jgi:hypothetical protein